MQKLTVLIALACLAVTASATSGTCVCTCSQTITSCPSDVGGFSCSCNGATATCSGSTSSCSDSETNCEQDCTAGCPVASGGTQISAQFSCSSSSSCFPASALVEMEDGSFKSMAELNVRDRVLEGHNTYSDVYMFSHRYAEVNSSFVSLKTDKTTTPLLITADHYLYVNGKLATAKTVRVGDELITGDGKTTRVIAVASSIQPGLFNPHTLTGDIVVNGIKTSTYTAAISPALAHSALWPVRMVYNLGHDVMGNYFDQGSQVIASLLPDGNDAY